MLKKHHLLVFSLTLVTLSIFIQPAFASDDTQPDDGAVICLPGVYMNTVSDCLASGPSQYLTELAQTGITFPPEPFPVEYPNFALTYVDHQYAQVRTDNAPVYGSLPQAIDGDDKTAIRRIDSPFSYISYYQDTMVDGARFYEIENGNWMTAIDVSRVTPPRFQGLTFTRTPAQTFGWVLSYLSKTSGYVETKRTPSYQPEDYTGNYYSNHDLVWVYDTAEADGIEWYMIGPDEWVPQNVIARVIPNTTPPAGVPGDRWIEVNLFEQTIVVYEGYELVFATLIATGLDPFWTRPGLFQIFEKLESTPMRGSFETDRSDAYYLEDVPWTMYFDQARALHGAYWRANLGFAQSHGCVNLSVGDSRWLFDWANLGDWIYVWDPSGETPTDPDYYGAGGA
ncbi:MAG: L,D-transpeptidase [Anaerolineales bacterium]|nr:L,D-transpeptidase [Anaerolineales bacterium]